MSMQEARRRVRELAIPLLDAHGPEGWREMIDPDTLAMTSMTQCVLGQVYGHFTSAVQALVQHVPDGIGDWRWPMRYGFDADFASPITAELERRGTDMEWTEYRELDAAWRKALRDVR